MDRFTSCQDWNDQRPFYTYRRIHFTSGNASFRRYSSLIIREGRITQLLFDNVFRASVFIGTPCVRCDRCCKISCGKDCIMNIRPWTTSVWWRRRLSLHSSRQGGPKTSTWASRLCYSTTAVRSTWPYTGRRFSAHFGCASVAIETTTTSQYSAAASYNSMHQSVPAVHRRRLL